MKKLISIFFLFLSFFAYAQIEKDYQKVISVSDLEEMLRSGKEVQLRNTYIKLDLKQEFGEQYKYGRKVTGKDSKFYKPVIDEETGEFKGWQRTYINNLELYSATFKNCMFDEFVFENCISPGLFLNNCVINNDFRLTDCEINNFQCESILIKKNSIIEKSKIESFTFIRVNTSNSIYAKACSVSFNFNEVGGAFFNGAFENIALWESTFKGSLSFDNCIIENSILLQDNIYEVDSSSYFQFIYNSENPSNSIKEFNFTNYYPSIVSFNESKSRRLSFKNNLFKKDRSLSRVSNEYNYSIIDCDLGELVFSNDTIYNINLNGTEISSKIDFNDFVINKSISIADMELPEYNVGFPWRMLSNKVNFYINDSTLYHAISDEELADEKLYNSYITAYKKFFSVYKNKGDLESSNACYVEMKDVETRRLKYLYETNGGSKYFLNYNLNRFLKYFADYGTSPVRSIQISGWVILIFSFFYFFFYSDWDRINRKFLINRGEKLISYFRSEQKLEDLYSEKHKEDINTYSQFRENLKESKAEVPFFFMLFLKPLYWVSVIKHQFNSFLYKRIEFLQGRWVDLSAGKKTLVGTATFFTILTYGLYLVAVRSLNSLILSINTFTTLGFGDIPVVGISRYVAILEGFLGWFLLSIFSVSLISQILQN